MKYRFSFTVAFGLAIAWPSAASASSTSNAAAAQSLFDDGQKLMAAKDFAHACPKFADSFKIDPAVGTLLNYGLCLEHDGRLASAWVTYNGVADLATKVNQKARAKAARQRAAELAPRLAHLTMQISGTTSVDGLQIRLDGALASGSLLGAPVPVDVGAHTIEASAPGHKTWSRTVDVAKDGVALVVEIPLLDSDSPPPVAASVASPKAAPVAPTIPVSVASHGDTSKRSTASTVGMVAMGVGVAGIGVGTYFGLSAKSSYDEAKNACGGSPTCTNRAAGQPLRDDADSKQSIATIACAAGGAALLGGGLLYFWPTKHAESTASVVVLPSNNGGLVSVQGAF